MNFTKLEKMLTLKNQLKLIMSVKDQNQQLLELKVTSLSTMILNSQMMKKKVSPFKSILQNPHKTFLKKRRKRFLQISTPTQTLFPINLQPILKVHLLWKISSFLLNNKNKVQKFPISRPLTSVVTRKITTIVSLQSHLESWTVK